MRRAYRGFGREMLRTGSWRALWMQVSTGARHALRRWLAPPSADPVALFLERYGPDGFRLPDPDRRALQHAAEGCLVCGLCSAECARAGGAPRLDPRDAVLSAARLEVDFVRLGLREPLTDACAACRACEAVCPSEIPIAGLQSALAELGRGGSAAPPPSGARDWRAGRESDISPRS